MAVRSRIESATSDVRGLQMLMRPGRIVSLFVDQGNSTGLSEDQ